MKALAWSLLLIVLVSGCARHVVVKREGGRISSSSSIMTLSDTEWTIAEEPAAEAEESTDDVDPTEVDAEDEPAEAPPAP